MVVFALIGYDMLAFIGIKEESSSQVLNTSGLNTYVRHPLYAGVILGLLGWLMLSPTYPALATFIITCLYVPIGIHFEEKKLITTYGKTYEDYRKAVPMLWPKLSK